MESLRFTGSPVVAGRSVRGPPYYAEAFDKGVSAASRDVAGLLAVFDAQLRSRVPRFAPVGAVVEQDGPLVRIQFGTHGIVGHRGLDGEDFGELIRRQQALFAGCLRPVQSRIARIECEQDRSAGERGPGKPSNG
ncbi:hypothetical protein [Kitasatospora azatica]|uniref:hypothetical protein n=1 Tax=Kitasatospora azatica TaxID=58347 RepID=UPI00056D991C|nr:hypothetical protein [Kitasatospora azatica]